MGKKLSELSIIELAVATIGTESRVGVDSAEAKAFRAEIARRATTDTGLSAYIARARRFAALIANGRAMDGFRSKDFSRADRELALALGAKRSWPNFVGTKPNLSDACR